MVPFLCLNILESGMNYSSTVVDIVAKIYESVAYDDVWQEVLNDISTLTGAHSGCLMVTDRQTSQLSVVSTRLSEKEIDTYIEHFSTLDERRLATENAPIGAIKKGSELLENNDFVQSEIYSKFLKPHDCFHSIGSCFYRDSQFIACIHFYRSEADSDFDNNSKKILGVLAPHLTRAFTISVQTKLAQLQSKIQDQIRHTTHTALFLIMDKSIAKPMNQKAQELINTDAILNLTNDRLTFTHPSTNKRFQYLVKQSLLTAQGKDIFPGGFIRLESLKQQTNEWHIGVTPYRGASQDKQFLNAKGALVIVRPVTKDSFQKLNIVLSDFYGLTASETQVLTKMISGLSASEVADELQLSKECVRSRLKKIYQKTGVSNQVQLTHDILEGPYKLANMLG